MSTTNNTYKIEPLNGENYVTWRRHLEWILDDLDLWVVTNGTEKEPTLLDPRMVTNVGELIKVRTSLVYFKYLSPEKNYQKGPLTINKII